MNKGNTKPLCSSEDSFFSIHVKYALFIFLKQPPDDCSLAGGSG